MSDPVNFSTSDIDKYELDLLIINILLTQADKNAVSKEDVIRACEYVLKKLAPKEEKQ